MNQKIKYILLQTLPVMVISGLIVTAMVYAWNEPKRPPPQDNVPAPINVGDVGQTKIGPLSVNGGFQSAGVTRLLSLTQIPWPAVLNFGNTTRQMINLWSSTPDLSDPGQYGIGIQNNTQYFRSAQNFAWYRGGTHDNTALSAGAGGSVLMSIIGSTGSVGIGTNNPLRKLQVAGQRDTASISVRNTDTINRGRTWSIFSTDSFSSPTLPKPGAFAIFDDEANVTRLSITSNGNVGIGTTNPQQKLHVVGGKGQADDWCLNSDPTKCLSGVAGSRFSVQIIEDKSPASGSSGTRTISCPSGTLRVGCSGGTIKNGLGGSDDNEAYIVAPSGDRECKLIWENEGNNYQTELYAYCLTVN